MFKNKVQRKKERISCILKMIKMRFEGCKKMAVKIPLFGQQKQLNKTKIKAQK